MSGGSSHPARRVAVRAAALAVALAVVALAGGCAAGEPEGGGSATGETSPAVSESTAQRPPLALPGPTSPPSAWPGGLTPSVVIDAGDAPVGGIHAVEDALWVIVDDHAVRIDPITGEQVSSFPVEPGSESLAVAGDWLWVKGERSGMIAQYRLPDGAPGKRMSAWMPSGLLVAHGSVWVSQHRQGTVLRIDPVTGDSTEVKVVAQGSSGPQSLLADDESVFVAVSRDNALYRIDPTTEAVEKLQGGAYACGGMAKVGQVVWGTGCFSGPWVAGFDTQTLQPAGQIDLGDRFGESLALVDDRLWVSIAVEAVEGGQVVTSQTGLALLDPAAHMVVRTFELLDGGGPMALAGDRLWVVGRTGNTILGFDTADLAAAANG